MIHKRVRHNQNYARFKSYTDINNYNNFLLELDKNQKENPPPISISSSSSSKNEVKDFVKNINKDFNDDTNFTGITPWECLLAAVEKHNDPNTYQSDENILLKEIFLPTTPVYIKKVNIDSEINNINDLLKLVETYLKKHFGLQVESDIVYPATDESWSVETQYKRKYNIAPDRDF